MQSAGYGDQLIGFGPLKSSTQEQILNFLVQTVRDPGGFDKLTTILEKEVKDNISRRGSEAWKALRDHYHQVSGARAHDLMNEFMRKQHPHESGATFVTRITNLRLSLGREGTNISTVQFKSAFYPPPARAGLQC